MQSITPEIPELVIGRDYPAGAEKVTYRYRGYQEGSHEFVRWTNGSRKNIEIMGTGGYYDLQLIDGSLRPEVMPFTRVTIDDDPESLFSLGHEEFKVCKELLEAEPK